MTGSAKQAGINNHETEIDWNMQNPYAVTAMEKDYWADNSQEDNYVQRQFADIASKYGTRGAEVNQQLNDAGTAPGSGTIGSFAYGQQISNPRAKEESTILNNQYNQRWAGEQNQFTRQGDYTTQLNDLAYKKAAGEQAARYDNRQNILNNRREDALNDQKNVSGLADMGLAALSAFPLTAPVAAPMLAAKKAGEVARNPSK